MLTCNDGIPHNKCSILEKIWGETGSAYAFIFYYPDEIAHTDKRISKDCIIEISMLNSMVKNNVKNEWNHRQWCNSAQSVLMTDLYSPVYNPTINVNSLLVEYRDANNDRLGFVNAYNLEELIKRYMKEHSLSTFNVILLDDKNCVAGALSKTDDAEPTTHMEKGIWQLSREKTNNTFHIFPDIYSGPNCNRDYDEYDLDNLEVINIAVDNISEDEVSKLDRQYSVSEMKPVTDKDIGKTNVDIFQD